MCRCSAGLAGDIYICDTEFERAIPVKTGEPFQIFFLLLLTLFFFICSNANRFKTINFTAKLFNRKLQKQNKTKNRQTKYNINEFLKKPEGHILIYYQFLTNSNFLK